VRNKLLASVDLRSPQIREKFDDLVSLMRPMRAKTPYDLLLRVLPFFLSEYGSYKSGLVAHQRSYSYAGTGVEQQELFAQSEPVDRFKLNRAKQSPQKITITSLRSQ
jgi:hypothetical protein